MLIDCNFPANKRDFAVVKVSECGATISSNILVPDEPSIGMNPTAYLCSFKGLNFLSKEPATLPFCLFANVEHTSQLSFGAMAFKEADC